MFRSEAHREGVYKNNAFGVRADSGWEGRAGKGSRGWFVRVSISEVV